MSTQNNTRLRAKGGTNDKANRPSVIVLTEQTYYDDHAVAGVGYLYFMKNGAMSGEKFMVVHDGYANTAQEVYVLYGKNYNNIQLVSFYFN